MSLTSRRAFLRQVGAASLAAMAAPAPRARAAAPEKKLNFVFILIDDMGWSDLCCYGNQFHETPNIDGLASQGMRFTDAYAACPVCSPTRASIMSGQYPAHVGITDFIPGHKRPWAKLKMPVNRTQYLPLEHVTMAEALKPAGYVTGAFGKWHLGGREYFPDKQGFDEMLVTNGRHTNFRTTPPTEVTEDDYLTETLSDRSGQFMEAHKDEPFLLYLSHYAVHIPLDARKELIEKYEKKEPKPSGGVNNPIYAGMVEHVDRSVGQVLKKIDDLGIADRTVVVFMSDNGGLRKRFDDAGPIVTTNAPLRDEKGSLYEGGIREPMIIRWPGVVKPGSECSVPVTSVDFYPTFLDMAGVKGDPKQALDGESLVPLLKQTRGLKRDSIYWHYPHYHHSTPGSAIRRGDWKLIEFFEDGRLELYNLRQDIGEAYDLSGKYPEKVKELQSALAAWRASINAPMPEPNPDYDPARAAEFWHPPRKRKPQPKKK